MAHRETWTDLKDIMLGKRSQAQRKYVYEVQGQVKWTDDDTSKINKKDYPLCWGLDGGVLTWRNHNEIHNDETFLILIWMVLQKYNHVKIPQTVDCVLYWLYFLYIILQ